LRYEFPSKTWELKNDGLEIVSKEDIEDLKLLSATRNEEKISLIGLESATIECFLM
jgi:hypothetical protein